MTTDLGIERADQATVREALALLQAQMRGHGIAIDESTLDVAVRGLVSVPERGAVLMARVAGDVVGVAVLAHTWTIEHGGACTWLDELYVVPEMRGRAIGTALLRHAIDLATTEGRRAIDLEVDSEHARVETLYQREGFMPLQRRRFARVLRAAPATSPQE
jgi:GNAT superfamily N-acetyltransferase